MERQAALLQAAYRLLAERGFEGLRTRDVAAEVGINVATLHYYFPTKEKLIRGVVGYAMGRFRSTLVPSGSPGELLRGHFAGLRRLARDEPELFAVMAELALRARRDRAIATIVRETDAAWRTTLAALIRRAAKEGTVRPAADPNELAGLIVAALKGTFLLPPGARPPADRTALDRRLRTLERVLGR